jgi:Acetyltransferase (GNAT) domain/Acetyltransferase (GNAT) family
MAELDIRPMSPEDIARAVDWAAAEGWNPGLDDADAFRATDARGFLMASLDGTPVSCISAVAYGGTYGFIGFYICAPEFRGRGHGLAVWNAGLARLAERTVGLDGVMAQQDNYRKSGFVLAHRNVRYGGRVDVEAPADRRVVTIGEAQRAAAVAYDCAFFPAPREAFLRAWLRPDLRRCLAFIDDGALRGYGVARVCRDGYKIGPLLADNEPIADALFRGLASAVGKGPLFIDPPEPNRAGRALAERYGLRPVFDTARMYRGPAPALPLERTYGITTFELG